MNVESTVNAAFEDELQKMAAKKKSGKGFRKAKRSFRRKKKSLFKMLTKYPVLEAIGSLALTTKGMHHLATGGMFGKRMKRFASSPRAGSLGSLGMGVGTTFLGAKGLAGIAERL
jgi:hypothetical protein